MCGRLDGVIGERRASPGCQVPVPSSFLMFPGSMNTHMEEAAPRAVNLRTGPRNVFALSAESCGSLSSLDLRLSFPQSEDRAACTVSLA